MDLLSYKLGKNSGGGSEPSEYNIFVDTNKIAWGSSIASGITNIDANAIDTSNINNLSSLFWQCQNLTTIPLLNTSKATSMSSMFSNCKKLEQIPRLNTSNVTDMSNMFTGCSALTTIPLLDTNKVQNMSSMFNNCYKLEQIPNIDTSSATNLSSMFLNCENLVSVPVLNIPKATNISYMFGNLSKLTDTSLDNILQMCISAASYKGQKTLQAMGIYTSKYPASRIQALPHYQDFVDAGWAIS